MAFPPAPVSHHVSMDAASGAPGRPKEAGASDAGPFFHGTKADLQPGDMLEPGYSSNYGERKTANFIYLSATLDAATWGAELAVGDGPGRIYRVSPRAPSRTTPT